MIVSTLAYSGNKRKLWKQIEPLLPQGEVFLDLFMGGGTISINVVDKYKVVAGSEIIPQVVEIHESLDKDKNFVKKMIKVNDHYSSDEEGYYKLREDYNVEPSPTKLLTLVNRSNTNYLRFSGKEKDKFNVPYGKRNHFNLERLQAHIAHCKEVDLHEGSYESLLDLYVSGVEDKGLVIYSDSPYSTTTATYCEGGKWVSGNDERLLEKLLTSHNQGAKIVISNVFENKGVVNYNLIAWCELHKDKFIVHHLNRNYNNCSFRKSNQKTDEVLIVSR